MGISKITRNYQISIPKDARKSLGLRIGDVVIVKTEDKRIVIEPIREKNIIDETFGLWGKSRVPGWKIVKKMRKEAEKRRKRLGI